MLYDVCIFINSKDTYPFPPPPFPQGITVEIRLTDTLLIRFFGPCNPYIFTKFNPLTVRLLQPGPLRQSWPIGLQENNNTLQESWLWANQPLAKKQKLLEAQNFNIGNKRFPRKKNVFLFKILHITPRKHICLTQAVILSSTSNFFATGRTLQ